MAKPTSKQAIARIAAQMADDAIQRMSAGGGDNIAISTLNYGSHASREIATLLQGDPRFSTVRHKGFMGYIRFQISPSRS